MSLLNSFAGQRYDNNCILVLGNLDFYFFVTLYLGIHDNNAERLYHGFTYSAISKLQVGFAMKCHGGLFRRFCHLVTSASLHPPVKLLEMDIKLFYLLRMRYHWTAKRKSSNF